MGVKGGAPPSGTASPKVSKAELNLELSGYRTSGTGRALQQPAPGAGGDAVSTRQRADQPWSPRLRFRKDAWEGNSRRFTKMAEAEDSPGEQEAASSKPLVS